MDDIFDDSIFDDDSEDMQARPLSSIGDFHLRSALSLPEVDELECGRGRRNEQVAWRRYKESFPRNNYKTCYPAKWLGLILNHAGSDFMYSKLQEIDNKLNDVALQLVKDEVAALKKMFPPGSTVHHMLHQTTEDHTIMTSEYSLLKWKLMGAVQYCNSLDHDRDTTGLNCFFSELRGIKVLQVCDKGGILLCGELVFLYYGEFLELLPNSNLMVNNNTLEKIVFYPQRIDFLRMLSDKVAERDNIVVATKMGNISTPLCYPPLYVLRGVWNIFDQGLREDGNEFYKVVKVYESIIVGLIINLKPSGYIPPGNDFVENTLKDIDEKGKRYVQALIDLLSYEQMNFQQLSQLHGLFRTWGHPIIDPIAGVQKMKKIGQSKKIINPLLPIMMDRKFKEKFYMSYYKKNQREYPPHSFKPFDSESYLHKQVSENRKINKEDPAYHPQDWDQIVCEKTYSLPETFNLSLLVADTAISPTREELKRAETNLRGALNPEWRRGVLKWMKDGVINCLLLLSLINICSTGLPLMFLIIGLYPKEREVNPVARMFSLMTLLMRAYFVITEDMLSKHILPHFKSISMTFDLLKLTKKLTGISRRQQKQLTEGRTFCINIDFEKWNLNFRRETTGPLFESLGRIFGKKNLYNRTYDIFYNSLMYLSDGSYMPLFDDQLRWKHNEPEKAFLHHLGGNEGLRQKGWTIGTSLMLDIVCEEHKIDYQLLGQGDNQVLMVTIYSDLAKTLGIEHNAVKLDIQDKLTKFLNALYSKSNLIGLPIKPLETWISDQFFAYGKVPIYEGVAGYQSLKKISRCFPFSNDDIMTLDNALGAISASFSSACMADTSPLPHYFISKKQSLLAAYWFQKFHPLKSEPVDISKPPKFERRVSSYSMLKSYPLGQFEMLEMIIQIPKILGGLNTHNLMGCYARGDPDPLTSAYCWMFQRKNYYFKQGDLRKSQLYENWIAPLINPVPRYNLLFSDPYAANLWSPFSTKTIAQQMIRAQVHQLAGDSQFALWFKELMRISSYEGRDRLIELLESPDRVFPRLGYAVIKGSLYGYSESVVSKIDKTVTLSRMTTRTDDVVGTIWIGELELWRYFAWRSGLFLAREHLTACSREYAQIVRNQSWKKEIYGVTSPCSYEVIKRSDEQCSENFIRVRTEVKSLLYRDRLEMFNGSAMPYLGSKIKEDAGFQVTNVAYGTDPLLARPVKLLNLLGWIIPSGSNFEELILRNLQSVTDFPLQIIHDNKNLLTDDPEQKFTEGIGERGAMWNFIFSIGSHCSANTLQWTDAGGKGDIVLQFQSLLCMIQFSFLNMLRGNCPTFQEDWITDCHRCITKTCKEQFDIDKPVPDDLFPDVQHNPYLFVPKDKVSIVVNKTLQLLKSFKTMSIGHLKSTVGSRTASRIVNFHLARDVCRQLGKHSSNIIDLEMAVLSADSFYALKINPGMLFNYIQLILWASLYKKGEHEGRQPNWIIDKGLLIKKLMKTPTAGFKGLLILFYSESVLNWLRTQSFFSPPHSYPVDISHGLVSMKTTLINYMRESTECQSQFVPLVLHEKLQSYAELIKVKIFNNLVHNQNRCKYCFFEIASIDPEDIRDIERWCHIKCESDHRVIPDSVIIKLSYFADSFKNIVDESPQFNFDRSTNLSEAKALKKARQKILKEIGEILRNNGIFMTLHNLLHDHTPVDLVHSRPFSTQWDYCYFLSSPITLPTRGYPRVVEVIGGRLSIIEDCVHAVIIGDGFGGSSLAVKELLPKTMVSSWTIFDSQKGLPNADHLATPPSHFKSLLPIQNYSSKWYGDIFSEEFDKAWKQDTGLMACDLLISEIELNHYPVNKSRQLLRDLVHKVLTLRRKFIFIKCQIYEPREMRDLLEIISEHQVTWELISTPLVNIDYGEFWIFCQVTDRRIDLNKIIDDFPSMCIKKMEEKRNTIELQVNHKEYESFWTKYHDIASELEIPDSPLELCVQDTYGWFYTAGITAWDRYDYTKMFNEVRQYKQPEIVMDKGKLKNQYMYSGDSENLRIRLIAIALSMLESLESIHDHLWGNKILILKWNIIKQEGRDGKLGFSYPFLVKNNGEYKEMEKNVLCKYISIIRYIKHKLDNKISFEEIGDSIRFTYVPKRVSQEGNQVKKKLYWRISKTMAEYINMVDDN
ncbi:polymerase protein [Yerba mate chlorosis-associated virus]|uniref:RNA-directed RNA polymerase n=1 Tax=Yerba mate chlorosis-associated virus TaxID=2487100 RepID=A0A1W5S0M4_9RHAB|nr:polymerase protein [Yerba mate chlorosis-associated virus]ARA91091.1 polymerase protein [Yerba mate chlorosis-associated virus]